MLWPLALSYLKAVARALSLACEETSGTLEATVTTDTPCDPDNLEGKSFMSNEKPVVD